MYRESEMESNKNNDIRKDRYFDCCQVFTKTCVCVFFFIPDSNYFR